MIILLNISIRKMMKENQEGRKEKGSGRETYSEKGRERERERKRRNKEKDMEIEREISKYVT